MDIVEEIDNEEEYPITALEGRLKAFRDMLRTQSADQTLDSDVRKTFSQISSIIEALRIDAGRFEANADKDGAIGMGALRARITSRKDATPRTDPAKLYYTIAPSAAVKKIDPDVINRVKKLMAQYSPDETLPRDTENLILALQKLFPPAKGTSRL